MKTILFFHRCELTDFYAGLSQRLKLKFNVIHVAYSHIEQNILIEKYNIRPDYIFQDLVAAEISSNIDVDILNEIDTLIIEKSRDRFTLNSSIQSDRGFSLLDYNEALLLAQSQYNVWKSIFLSVDIDFFYHEPPSLFMNHIASMLCLSYNAKYCYDSMVKGENEYNYILLMQDTAYSPEINSLMHSLTPLDIENNKDRISNFLNEFRRSSSVFLGDKIKSNHQYVKAFLSSIKSFVVSFLRGRSLHKLKDNIDYFLTYENMDWKKFKNLINYKIRVRFDDLDVTNDYYYYSMNLEPEATVLYLGDGIYENQVKLVINIASQLPPNTYLYVKDHPHFVGYRNYEDYLRLIKVPNIKVLKAQIPGKTIIKDCIGVLIINGTAGLEAIMLNKQVFTFGNMFFNVSDRVEYIKHIKELRSILYAKRNVIYKDDLNLYKFVLSYLNASHEGVTDYFQGRMSLYNIDYEKNIDKISENLSSFFNAN